MSKETKPVLNDEQRQAVEHKDGPLLIVAGAGTGKTTVVTERIKWLIATGLAKPEEILALTFTEKAALEMETRVDEALPYGTIGLWISTFHSFCDRILREEALNIGLNPSFKLMTEAERIMFVKKNFWMFDLKEFRPSGNPYKFIEAMQAHFDRLKDEDILPENYENDQQKELVPAFKLYEDLKAQEGVMDFSDLIGNTLKLFRSRPRILEKYQQKFKFALIDEFQDTNYAQYELIKLLSDPNDKLTVIGDDNQSIYRFRGASVSNILSFIKDYPSAKQVVLTKNYRSTQVILDSAYKLIKNNDPDTLESRLGINKNLISQIDKVGEKIELIYVDRVEDEAELVIQKIKDLKKTKNYEFKDFAILVRANNHSEPFIRSLERERIPYQFLGPGQLFHQPEIKDLIAYLKFLADFTDSASLYRVLSMDPFDISQRDIIFMLGRAKKQSISLFETIEQDGGEKWKNFVTMVHRHQGMIKSETAGQILYDFLEESGLLAQMVKAETQKEELKVQNVSKFFDKLKSFEATNEDSSVFAIVDYLLLAMDMGESPLAAETDWLTNNAVNILTVHSSKGLEFPVVFLVNLIEGRFPSRERKELIPIPDNLIKEVLPEGDFHLQEERRLFYVGMTRAKEQLIFSAANFYGEGKRERKLSQFVIEAIGEKTFKVMQKEENQLPLFEWKKSPEAAANNEPSVNKVDYLSYSALETFKTCPLHYKLKYILKIPTPPTASQSLGNSVHQTLRDFYQSGGDALEILKKNWIKEGYESKSHEQEAFEKAKEFLAAYFESDLHKNAHPIILEQPFTLRLDGLRILGKIDRVDDLGNGEIEIIDYKTGKHVPTQKEIDADLQMGIYALAAVDKGILGREIEKVKMCFYFFDSKTKITTTRSLEDLKETKKQIFECRDEIEKSDFACNHSQICQNCEFKILCNG